MRRIGGRAPIEGCAVNAVPLGPEESFHRAFKYNEFDVSEISLSSYTMTAARGGNHYIGIPAFVSRVFRPRGIHLRPDRGIREPKDLIGKRVGLNTFQTTLSVLAKGDLQTEYGVPWRKIEWHISADEVVPFTPEQGVVIRRLPEGKNLGPMLQDGEIDAIFRPHPPRQALEGARNIVRLFPDSKAEEARYFRKYGYYPIMHVVAFRDRVLEQHPRAYLQFHPPGITDRQAGKFTLDANELGVVGLGVVVEPVGVDQPRQVVGRVRRQRVQERLLV